MDGMEKDEVEFRLLFSDSLKDKKDKYAPDGSPDPRLEDGLKLPSTMAKKFPKDLKGFPVEELDPYYKEKLTCVVIDASNIIHRFYSGSVIFNLDPLDSVRRISIRIICHPIFRLLVSALILFNLYIEVNQKTSQDRQYIVMAIYLVEVCIRIIARGLVKTEFSYLRDPWNCLDLVLIMLAFYGWRYVLVFRTFRFLKPYVTVSGLKSYFTEFSGFIVYGSFILGYLAVIAMGLYQGSFLNTCVIDSAKDLDDANYRNWIQNENNWDKSTLYCGNSTGSRMCKKGYTCVNDAGGDDVYWYQPTRNPDYGFTNFDWIGPSFFQILRLATLDSWASVYHYIHYTSYISSPILLMVPFVSIPFINLAAVIMVYSVINYYKKIKDKSEESNRSSSKPTTTPTSGSGCQNYLSKIMFHPFMHLFVCICIIIYTFLMAMDHYDMSAALEHFLMIGNYIFTLIFTLEVTLKIIAIPKTYFKNPYNVFDAIIVTFGILELCLENISGLSVLRTFRLLRIIRLIKYWPNSRVTICWKSIFKLFAFSIAIFSSFAIYGMHNFGKQYHDNAYRFPNQEIPTWSFIDFFHSFLTVFRVFNGESFESLLDCMLVSGYNCVSYFWVSIFLVHFGLMNLFLAAQIFNMFKEKGPEKYDEDYQKLKMAFSMIKTFFTKESNKIKQKDPKDTQEVLVELKSANDIANEEKFKQEDDGHAKYNIFKYFILVVILISCICQAMKDHANSSAKINIYLNYINYLIIIIFLVEIFVKWFTLSVRGYFSSFLNWMDFFIVVPMVINIFFGLIGFGTINILFSLRCLRIVHILLFLTKYTDIQIILDTLKNMCPSLIPLWVTMTFIGTIFPILGVQMFAGKFYHCIDESGQLATNVHNKTDCFNHNYTWVNPLVNFDHIMSSSFALNHVLTRQGWIEIMANAAASKSLDDQPEKDINIYMYWYFIIFIIFAAIPLYNLFAGVILSSYLKAKYPKAAGFGIEIEPKQLYLNTIKKIKNGNPYQLIPRPENQKLGMIYDLVNKDIFDVVIQLIIIIFVFLIAMDSYIIDRKTWFYNHFVDFNRMLILCFWIEFMLKLLAFRLHYFKNWVNIFNLVSLIGATSESFINGGSLLLSLRIFQILPIFGRIPCTRSIYTAVNESKKLIGSIIILLITIAFIYANLGTALFSSLNSSNGFDEIFNFKSFTSSFKIMLQLIAYGDWDVILHALVDRDNCPNEFVEANRCGGDHIPEFFITSYMVITHFIIFNIYFAILFASYSEVRQLQDLGINYGYFDRIFKIWKRFDKKGLNSIENEDLKSLMEALKEVDDDKKELNIQVKEGGLVRFEEVMVALIDHQFEKNGHSLEMREDDDLEFIDKEAVETKDDVSKL